MDDALAAAAKLPRVGRYSVESAAWLAAALVAAGRDKEAYDLVTRFPAKGSTGRLVAAMSKAAAWNNWDPVAGDREMGRSNWIPCSVRSWWKSSWPRAFANEALRFANSLKNPAERTEAAIAWCEAAERAGQQAKARAPVAVDPVLEKLPPAARARAEARLGIVRLRVRDREEAEKRLKRRSPHWEMSPSKMSF